MGKWCRGWYRCIILLALATSVVNAPAIAEEVSYTLGWSNLPVQTKVDGLTLSCRDARIVLYSDINHDDAVLGNEVRRITADCAVQTAVNLGLSAMVSEPSSYFASFVSGFAVCAVEKGQLRAEVLRLYTRNEHGNWRSC